MNSPIFHFEKTGSMPLEDRSFRPESTVYPVKEWTMYLFKNKKE